MLSIKNYLSLLLIFLVIFIIFMSVALSSDILAEDNIDVLAGPAPAITAGNAPLESYLDEGIEKPETWAVPPLGNRRAALIVSGPEDAMAGLLKEWCLYNKYSYRVYTELPPPGEIQKFNAAFFGELSLGEESIEVLEGYGLMGVPLVFTRLPSFQVLSEFPRLADFFGIKKCIDPFYPVNGIKVFADFFLSSERIYTNDDYYGEEGDMDFTLPYYILRPGYEVYAVAVLQEQGQIKNEELPSLLWRTYSGSSFIFVVNSTVFPAKSMLGIITAFLSQAHGIYLYPVVNGHTVVTLNYPTFAEENSAVLQARYSRTSRSFKRDILWPNIVKVLKYYEQSYDFFAVPRLNGGEKTLLEDEDVSTYWKEIAKLGGTVGLSLEELSALPLARTAAFNGEFFENVFPDFRFTALYGGRFSLAELGSYFQDQPSPLFSNVSLVLANFQEGERFFQYLNDRVLGLLITRDGYEHESLDDFQMIALETALGYCVQQINMVRVLFPEGEEDDWNYLAERWSAGKTYYENFHFFSGCSIYELEERVRRFLALNYCWHAEKNRISVSIPDLQGEAWFILRVHNAAVKEVTGGTFKKLSSQSYLIQAQEKEVAIGLQETNFLLPPDGGRER